MENVTTAEQVSHAEHGHDEHHELSFLQSYVFSLDHKVIGIQYAITAMLFLLLGFTLMMTAQMRL